MQNNHYCEDGTASGDYMACSINKDKSAITLDKSGIPEKGDVMVMEVVVAIVITLKSMCPTVL